MKNSFWPFFRLTFPWSDPIHELNTSQGYLFDNGQSVVSVQYKHFVLEAHLLGALAHEVLVRSVVLDHVLQGFKVSLKVKSQTLELADSGESDIRLAR